MSRAGGRRNASLRQLALLASDLVLLRGAVARWSYRFGLHGKLGVTTHRLQVAESHALPGPLVLAFASDFHAGHTTHPDLFSRLLDEVSRHEPDVLLLGGDFVDSRAEHVDVLAERLRRCHPRLGKYAVLGNHDVSADGEHIAARLTSAGVAVLVNRNVPLPAPFECVSICGIDDPWFGRPDGKLTFSGAGAVRIFLSHSPDGLLALSGERFELGFAGHTHGGQVALRDGTPIINAGGPLSRSYSRGRFEISGNGPLIVSRGIGCSSLPIRINSDPELIICELYS